MPSFLRSDNSSWRETTDIARVSYSTGGIRRRMQLEQFQREQIEEKKKLLAAKEEGERESGINMRMKEIFAAQEELRQQKEVTSRRKFRPALRDIPVNEVSTIAIVRPKDKLRAKMKMASATEEKKVEKAKHPRDRALDEAPDDDLILNTLEWDYARTFSFQRGRSENFEVEASGYYAIWVAGASGADVEHAYTPENYMLGGSGAQIAALFLLEKNQTLRITIGGAGDWQCNEPTLYGDMVASGGGGGATSVCFLLSKSEVLQFQTSGAIGSAEGAIAPLLVAGGGGGATSTHRGGDAPTDITGVGSDAPGPMKGCGGWGGSGGCGGQGAFGSGGAGFLSDGIAGPSNEPGPMRLVKSGVLLDGERSYLRGNSEEIFGGVYGGGGVNFETFGGGGGGGYSGGGGGLHGGGGGGNFLAAIQRGIIAKKSSNRGHGFAKILPLDKATLQKVLTLGGVPNVLLSRVDKMSIAKEQGKILGGALSELERRKLKNMKMHRKKYEAYLAEKQQDRKLQKRRQRRRNSDGSISLSNTSSASSVASKFGFPTEQRRGSMETIATVESLSGKLPKISGFDRTEEEKETKLQLRSKEKQWQLEDQQHEEQLEKDFAEGKIKKLPSAWEKRNAKKKASLNRRVLGMPFNYLVTSLPRTHAQLRLPTSGFI